jgi:hypothetical protein
MKRDWDLIREQLTMRGHDLLDTIRSKPVSGVELTFDAIKALAAVALPQVLAD